MPETTLSGVYFPTGYRIDPCKVPTGEGKAEQAGVLIRFKLANGQEIPIALPRALTPGFARAVADIASNT